VLDGQLYLVIFTTHWDVPPKESFLLAFKTCAALELNLGKFN